MHREAPPEAWYLYVLRTRDGAIYTGVATDVARRITEHEGGGPRAAKSLRGNPTPTTSTGLLASSRKRRRKRLWNWRRLIFFGQDQPNESRALTTPHTPPSTQIARLFFLFQAPAFQVRLELFVR